MNKIVKILCSLSLLFVGSFNSFSQINDNRTIVGVQEFTADESSPFISYVQDKVVKVVSDTKRFNLLDRTNMDKVHEELELQKSEAFIDSENLAQQGMAVGAQYLILGHVTKMKVFTKTNNGSVMGYQASVAFTLQVTDVETGLTTEAASFQSDLSKLAASKTTAVNQALQTLEQRLFDYFAETFPVKTKIVKILEAKKDAAITVLTDGGSAFGIPEGGVFSVESMEMIGGKPFFSEIGQLKVVKLSGKDFCECKVLKGGKEILSHFNAAGNITCKLLTK